MYRLPVLIGCAVLALFMAPLCGMILGLALVTVPDLGDVARGALMMLAALAVARPRGGVPSPSVVIDLPDAEFLYHLIVNPPRGVCYGA